MNRIMLLSQPPLGAMPHADVSPRYLQILCFHAAQVNMQLKLLFIRECFLTDTRLTWALLYLITLQE
jgi:hypothetical protein